MTCNSTLTKRRPPQTANPKKRQLSRKGPKLRVGQHGEIVQLFVGRLSLLPQLISVEGTPSLLLQQPGCQIVQAAGAAARGEILQAVPAFSFFGEGGHVTQDRWGFWLRLPGV